MNDLPPPNAPLRLVDAHVHFYDADVNVHPFLDEKDSTYEALVPGYLALPRRYSAEDYLMDTRAFEVQGIVWHEYLSTNALEEVRWAQRLAESSPLPMAIVGLVNFLDPDLRDRLAVYQSLPNVTAVREHLGWDATNPLRRFARRPDLLEDPAWQAGLECLRNLNLKCGLEVFGPQLSDLLPVIQRFPDIGFTVAVMGWPTDFQPAGIQQWRRDMQALSQCQNVCVEISAVECVFGMDWTVGKISSWVRFIIETFGPARCMFGSVLPLSKLALRFEKLYHAYQQLVAGFSLDEQDLMFRQVAANWFSVNVPTEKARA